MLVYQKVIICPTMGNWLNWPVTPRTPWQNDLQNNQQQREILGRKMMHEVRVKSNMKMDWTSRSFMKTIKIGTTTMIPGQLDQIHMIKHHTYTNGLSWSLIPCWFPALASRLVQQYDQAIKITWTEVFSPTFWAALNFNVSSVENSGEDVVYWTTVVF